MCSEQAINPTIKSMLIFLHILYTKLYEQNKPQYQVIFTSTGVLLIIRASVSHRSTLPYLILNADLESLKHRL